MITDNLQKAIEWLEKYMQMKRSDGMLWMTSPYAEIDEETSGVIPGKVYVIAWYSNTGKSKFAYTYANHYLWKKKKVHFYSLEVDVWMVLWNLACNKYQKRFWDLELDDINLEDFDWLSIYDDKYSIDAIIQNVMDEKPDVVFIDFIQNVQCPGNSEYERMSTIARDVQQLAIQSGATVFSLSQVSNTTGRDISKWDRSFISLKGAGELYASSEVVFLLSNQDGYIACSIIKNKFGKKNIDFLFDVDFSRWVFVLQKVQDKNQKTTF